MRLKYSNKSSRRVKARKKNKVRIRKKVQGSEDRPRLCVFRSGRHMYAQIVDDSKGVTIAAASSLETKADGDKSAVAKAVGLAVAKKALEKNIKSVVFDRGGFVYHGRVKAVADGAREAGLNF